MLPDDEPDSDGCTNQDAAFSFFYRSLFVSLVAQSIRFGVPAADAPGLVQDLMLEIYARWADISFPGAYARRTVAFRAADLLKQSSRLIVEDGAYFTGLGYELTSGLPHGLLAVEGEQLVLEALAQLPPIQRAVFALTYDGFPCEDIGEILGMKEATVRSNLRHARRTLSDWWNRRARLGGGATDARTA
jgi:RNA polymerase sigma factor (sigma-70 family)